VTLTADSGAEINVVVEEGARILRTSAAQRNLKEAAPAQLSDVQIGDRMLVLRGQPADDGKSVLAASIVLMKQSDISERQEREREDWQKRGAGGLVTAVDPAQGTVTISNLIASGKQNVLVRISKDTVIRRYAPDSVKFDDAKPGTLAEIKPGDQLRARGSRNPEGTEISAEEVVSGAFRNIAGTVNSTDAATGTVNVMDLVAKKAVTVKITADSQLRALPPLVAQRIALRLKGPQPDAGSNSAPGTARSQAIVRSGGASGTPGGSRPGGPGDLQQMLNHMPTVAIAELKKGDAITMVVTPGSAGSDPTAITLLTGVEPILTAAPNARGAAMLMSPWNLGSSISDAMAP
jgi:hypothetical protein